jgi:hypothetical protein
MRHRRTLAALAVAAALTAGCGDPAPARSDRQAEVASRGASVMPFDLDRTSHHFDKTGDGGVQTVVADNPSDSAQVGLIREHLRLEADRFRRGDFTDPTRIHGTAMPGLEPLKGSAGRIDITFAETSGGARITYTTVDATLVTALHAWFDAQVSDHGAHATGG